MVDVVKIKLWDKDLGALSWDREKNIGSFQFFSDFKLNQWDVSPIYMSIQSAQNKIYSFPHLNEDTFKGLPGLLSDVLPDDFGNQLINQWLILNNINQSDFTPLDRLCYIGTRGMGALEFEPAKNLKFIPSTNIHVDKLVELTQLVLNKRNKLKLNIEQTEELNELIKVGTSAGGQRAKGVIAYNAKTNEIKSGQTEVPKDFEHYLFKFDGVDDKSLSDPKGFGRIEYAYYLMATACGIEMMPSQLFEENGRAHFMTKRFDRLANNEKLHMQTLCSLAHFDYKKQGAYAYENVFDVMRKLRLPHADAVQLFKRMVFNVVARNQDDHTKNISFLMNKEGVWSLSPAYDVTYSYNPDGVWTNTHQMSINGKLDGFTMEDLIAVGSKISLNKSKVIVEEIIKQVRDWEIYAKEAEVPKEQYLKLQKTFRLKL